VTVLHRTEISQQRIDMGHARRFEHARGRSACPPTPDISVHRSNRSGRPKGVASLLFNQFCKARADGHPDPRRFTVSTPQQLGESAANEFDCNQEHQRVSDAVEHFGRSAADQP
jgi:hypothetical protein